MLVVLQIWHRQHGTWEVPLIRPLDKISNSQSLCQTYSISWKEAAKNDYYVPETHLFHALQLPSVGRVLWEVDVRIISRILRRKHIRAPCDDFDSSLWSAERKRMVNTNLLLGMSFRTFTFSANTRSNHRYLVRFQMALKFLQTLFLSRWCLFPLHLRHLIITISDSHDENGRTRSTIQSRD